MQRGKKLFPLKFFFFSYSLCQNQCRSGMCKKQPKFFRDKNSRISKKKKGNKNGFSLWYFLNCSSNAKAIGWCYTFCRRASGSPFTGLCFLETIRKTETTKGDPKKVFISRIFLILKSLPFLQLKRTRKHLPEHRISKKWYFTYLLWGWIFEKSPKNTQKNVVFWENK